MKNLSSILLGIFCLALAGLTFSSCRGNEGGEEEIKPDYNPEISTWYKEFESIKQTGTFGLCWGHSLRIPELKLNDYTYKGVYDTPEKLAQLREDIFSDETYFPAYRGSLDVFSLETWNQMLANEPDNIDPDWWRPEIEKYLHNDPEVVELHWTYNDNLSFTTYALVSPFKIIYDNILSFLIYYHGSKSTKSTEMERRVLPTKSSSEDSGANSNNGISHTEYHEVVFSLGNKKYYSQVSCTLSGEKINGDQIVKDIKLDTDNNVEGSNYQSKEDITEKSFSKGSGGSVSYDYACGIANASNSVSLTYEEGSYSFFGSYITKDWGSNAILANEMD